MLFAFLARLRGVLRGALSGLLGGLRRSSLFLFGAPCGGWPEAPVGELQWRDDAAVDEAFGRGLLIPQPPLPPPAFPDDGLIHWGQLGPEQALRARPAGVER